MRVGVRQLICGYWVGSYGDKSFVPLSPIKFLSVHVTAVVPNQAHHQGMISSCKYNLFVPFRATLPPKGVNFRLLEIRFLSTCESLVTSPDQKEEEEEKQ
jgi:hypothetical protein